MGELIEYASNGSKASGYLSLPEGGAGPGVIVIQEWWGLVPHITDVADRVAAQGFVALAPDLYGGKKTTEPDEAGKEMMALRIPEATKDMSGAVDELLASLFGRSRRSCGLLHGRRPRARPGRGTPRRRCRVRALLRVDPLARRNA